MRLLTVTRVVPFRGRTTWASIVLACFGECLWSLRVRTHSRLILCRARQHNLFTSPRTRQRDSRWKEAAHARRTRPTAIQRIVRGCSRRPIHRHWSIIYSSRVQSKSSTMQGRREGGRTQSLRGYDVVVGAPWLTPPRSSCSSLSIASLL